MFDPPLTMSSEATRAGAALRAWTAGDFRDFEEIRSLRMRNAEDAAVDATLFPLDRKSLPTLRRKLAQLSGVDQIWTAPDRLRLRLADQEVVRLASEMINAGLPPLLRPPDVPEEYIVSFCDPNATKGLHIGHMRSLALGGGLGALLEAAGVRVTRQSIVCDSGRAISEACAGYVSHYQGETPRSQGCRPDQFVGRCYAQFEPSSGYQAEGEPDHDSRNAPGEGADLAGDYMKRLWDEDPEALRLWQGLREWVIEGHRHTFDRTGIIFDRTLYESEFLYLIEPVMESALATGIFIRSPEDGSIDMVPTAEGPKVPMVRRDGFPTGYLRHFAIWHELQRRRPLGVGYLNIMGSEWTEKAAMRERALTTLLDDAFDRFYHRIGVGMVMAAGEPIKSKSGTAFLIEDCLDWIANEVSLGGRADPSDEIPALILKGYLLSQGTSASIDFCPERLLDPQVNPGLKIATALFDERPPAGQECRSGLRYAVCRALELRPILEVALVKHELAPVVKFLGHLAGWCSTALQGPLTRQLTFLTIGEGARSINLLGQVPAATASMLRRR